MPARPAVAVGAAAEETAEAAWEGARGEAAVAKSAKSVELVNGWLLLLHGGLRTGVDVRGDRRDGRLGATEEALQKVGHAAATSPTIQR